MEFLTSSSSYQKFPRVLLFASTFIFLLPPRGLGFGFFPRQEFVFQVLVGVGLLVCAVWIAWIRPEKITRSIVQQLTAIDKTVIGLFLAYLLSTLLAPNFQRSFFGILDRMTGFLSLAYAVGYYALIRVALSKENVFRFLCWTSLAIGLAGAYALLQSAALIDAEFGLFGRPVGPLTNPVMLATYLMFGVFISLFCWLRLRARRSARSPVWQWLTFFSVVGSCGGLIATQTRGAFLGVVVACLLLAVLLMLDKRSNSKTKRLSGVVLGMAGLGVALIIVQLVVAPFDFGYSLMSRVTDVEDLGSSFFNRSIAWHIALKAFGERPVLGWGLDNYAQPFDAHFDTRLVEDAVMPESWFDKAHNIFLDVLATTGAVGLAAYLAFLISLVWGTWTLYKHEQFFAPLIALLCAYVVNGLLTFDTFHSTTMLFAIGAAVSVGVSSTLPATRTAVAPGHVADWLVRGVATVACLVLLYATVAYNLVPLRGLGHHYSAWRQVTSATEQAKVEYSKDFELRHPYTLYDWEYLALFLLTKFDRLEQEQVQEMTSYALEQFEALEQTYAVSARDYFMAGQLGNLTADMSEPVRTLTWRYLEKADELSPDKPDVLFEMARYYKHSNDYERAIELIRQVERQHPNVALTYMNLGLAYAEARDFGNAISAFETAFDRGYDDWKNSPTYVHLLWQVYAIDQYVYQHLDRLAEILEAQTALEGGMNANTWSELAAVYLELKDYDKARAAALKVVEASPEAKTLADEFLKNLPD